MLHRVHTQEIKPNGFLVRGKVVQNRLGERRSSGAMNAYTAANAVLCVIILAAANLLFNSIIGNTKNKFKAGINFSYDQYIEAVDTFNFEGLTVKNYLYFFQI